VSDYISYSLDFANVEIMLNADHPREVAANAFLKLCRLDVNAETERWARTPPKFSADGRIALITVASGFQSELIILQKDVY
jgi:hypothetical protein